MKRRDLLRKISNAATATGTDFVRVRQGAELEIYRYGSQQFSVPRHREINELTARGILRDLGIGIR